ncbi:unnamed protein product, partial [Rotaria sp. Silwood2]
QITPINKYLAPNLHRLNIKWSNSFINLETINELFTCDVLYSLTNFTLLANIVDSVVIRNLLLLLSNSCLYLFDVKWTERIKVSAPNTNEILSIIFQNMRGSAPVELELSMKTNVYYVRAVTIPRMDKSLCLDCYL